MRHDIKQSNPELKLQFREEALVALAGDAQTLARMTEGGDPGALRCLFNLSEMLAVAKSAVDACSISQDDYNKMRDDVRKFVLTHGTSNKSPLCGYQYNKGGDYDKLKKLEKKLNALVTPEVFNSYLGEIEKRVADVHIAYLERKLGETLTDASRRKIREAGGIMSLSATQALSRIKANWPVSDGLSRAYLLEIACDAEKLMRSVSKQMSGDVVDAADKSRRSSTASHGSDTSSVPTRREGMTAGEHEVRVDADEGRTINDRRPGNITTGSNVNEFHLHINGAGLDALGVSRDSIPNVNPGSMPGRASNITIHLAASDGSRRSDLGRDDSAHDSQTVVSGGDQAENERLKDELSNFLKDLDARRKRAFGEADTHTDAGIQTDEGRTYVDAGIQTDEVGTHADAEIRTDEGRTHTDAGIQTDEGRTHTDAGIQTDEVGTHAGAATETDEVDTRSQSGMGIDPAVGDDKTAASNTGPTKDRPVVLSEGSGSAYPRDRNVATSNTTSASSTDGRRLVDTVREDRQVILTRWRGYDPTPTPRPYSFQAVVASASSTKGRMYGTVGRGGGVVLRLRG
ncbi:hypothetical protein WL21_04745 [Burkholderia ubonensis]|nr:hypothetical protein WJ81_15715 [Burkholderia ubonensis]KVZ57311.1 hypothetical protein WL20_23500 [Burkholderia ubonensis]KVZ73008.1 hypothetical protein WL21_04745 [Burkholderia ubonensis]